MPNNALAADVEGLAGNIAAQLRFGCARPFMRLKRGVMWQRALALDEVTETPARGG